PPRSTFFPYTMLFRSLFWKGCFHTGPTSEPLLPNSRTRPLCSVRRGLQHVQHSQPCRLQREPRQHSRFWTAELAVTDKVGYVEQDRKSTRLNSSHQII